MSTVGCLRSLALKKINWEAGSVAQLARYLPSIHEVPDSMPSIIKQGEGAQACNYSTWKVEARGLGVHCASLNYRKRPRPA